MLNSEGDANNGDEACQGSRDVTNCEPHTSDDEPHDVSNHAQWTGSNIFNPAKGRAADCFLSEWKEGELADNKAGLGPWQTDDGDGTKEASKPPAKPHDEAAKDKPKDIANFAQSEFSLVQRQNACRAMLVCLITRT